MEDDDESEDAEQSAAGQPAEEWIEAVRMEVFARDKGTSPPILQRPSTTLWSSG